MNLGDVNLYTFPSNILEFFPPLPKKTNQNKPRQNKTNKKQTKPKKKKTLTNRKEDFTEANLEDTHRSTQRKENLSVIIVHS